MTMAVLGDVALKLQDGPFGSNLKSSHYTDEGVRVVRLQNIGAGFFDDRDQAFISPAHFAKLQKHECSAGDVLVATLGDPILRATVQPRSLPVTLNKADCIQLRCDPDRAVAGYVTHYLNSNVAQSHASALAHGQTRPRVNLSQLRRLPIPLPPIEEQQRIAAVLDAADALRAKRRQAIAKLDTLTQAIFIDMFGDPAERRYPMVKIGDLVRSRITRGIDQPGPEVDGGVPYIKTTNFGSGVLDRSDLALAAPEIAQKFPRSIVEVGDTVICIRATVGPVLLVNKGLAGANLSRGTARIAPSAEVAPEFLFEAVRSDHFQHQIRRRLRGATFLQIPLGELKELEVPLPPVDAQLTMSRRREGVLRLASSASVQETEIDGLFASLQQRAFRGEL